MPINFMDVLNPENITTYITNLPPQNLLGSVLFPASKQMGIDITLIKGAKNKAVALKPSAFDVAVKVRALRASVDEKTKEMPFFKESVVIKERDRQNLLLAMQANNQQMRDLILNNIYGDISTLVDGADVQAERMRMQLLSDGKIYISTDDTDISLDFEIPTGHQEILAGTAKWNDFDNADIVGDIERWVNTIESDQGVTPSILVMTKATFNLIKQNKAIKLDINKDGTTIMTDAIITAYLQNKLGVSVAIENGKYFAEDGTTQLPYYPDNKITLIPKGTLGSTHYGTTPEEADLMSGASANVSIVRDGIAVTTVKQTDPVQIQTKVSQICMPSFEHSDEVFIATVA